MTKQEKIQEAYGEHWAKVKDLVDENGWTEFPNVGSYNIEWQFGGRYGEIADQFFCRPHVLRGIENNGWIKIESEKDLPKVEGVYFFYHLDPDHVFVTNQVVVDRNGLIELYEDFEITHYQPIQKPEPPIY